MDPITTSIVTSLAANYFSGYTQSVVNGFFDKVFGLKPELKAKLKAAQSSQELQEFFGEASGVIEASAAEGKINVDGSLLEAIRGIRFNHQNGTVTIGNTTVASAVVVTGGSAGSTGQTVIGAGSNLNSAGTGIQVGRGGTITITGGASITQT
jgi:hypothetical protein